MCAKQYKVKSEDIRLPREKRYHPEEKRLAEKFGFDRMKDLYRITWGDAIDKGKNTTLDPFVKQMATLAAEENRIIVWRTIFQDLKSRWFDWVDKEQVYDLSRALTDRVRSEYKRMVRYKSESEKLFATQGDLNPKVIDLIHENGMEAFHWGDGLFDNFCPPHILYRGETPHAREHRLQKKNPGICRVDRFGRPHYGVWEYRYPEAREATIERFLFEMESYDFDGMVLSTRTHSTPAIDGEQYGYNDVIEAELLARTGVSFREPAFWRRPDVQETRRRIVGESLTLFLRDLRAAWPKEKKLYIGIPRGDYFGPPYGNIFIDWRTWAHEKLIDGLYIGEVSGKALYYPAIHDEEYRNYISDEESGLGIRPYLFDLEHIYGPACKAAGVELFVQRDSKSVKEEMFGGQYRPTLERGEQPEDKG